VFRLRAATIADLAELLPRTRALNDHEGIAVGTPALEAALDRLLRDPTLGGAWLVERDAQSIGYVVVTFGYDLEFAGRDAWLTEIWIDPPARGQGAGTAALALIADELRALDVRAVHLQVRADNPAIRVYHRAGFATVPRQILSRRLI
jgi:ribosomal protein S18 acetylase RimI-like enzyme